MLIAVVTTACDADINNDISKLNVASDAIPLVEKSEALVMLNCNITWNINFCAEGSNTEKFDMRDTIDLDNKRISLINNKLENTEEFLVTDREVIVKENSPATNGSNVVIVISETTVNRYTGSIDTAATIYEDRNGGLFLQGKITDQGHCTRESFKLF